MPRIARIIAPGYAHHITQRGNNRTQVFFDDEDRRTYLKLLSRYADKYKLQIWAWCLMDNHVHLLVIPDSESSMARGIGLTNMVYTQYLNRKLGQSGRIWQNRFFSCVVEGNEYLWAVACYIECNPVKAGIVENAEEYLWSSARVHLKGFSDDRVILGDWLEPSEREGYAVFVATDDAEQNTNIRKATRTGRPLGTESFIDTIEYKLNRTVRAKKAGRPRKHP